VFAMNFKVLSKRKEVDSYQSETIQKEIVKKYQMGISTFQICKEYNVSESALYRVVRGHLGRRPAMFRKKVVTKNDSQKKEKRPRSKSIEADRIEELEKELKKKNKEIESYKDQIEAVKDFLGKF
jgi:transposase-like protein